MDVDLIGQPFFHTRVENWETDFNGHWNTRFYARSFQMAAETIAASKGGSHSGVKTAISRHMRFHRELFPGASVEVRSAAITGGPYDGAIVHFLYESGGVSATAIDLPGIGSKLLQPIPNEELNIALPRGLLDPVPLPWVNDVSAPLTFTSEAGTVRPSETDHTGHLEFDEIIRRCAHASHHHITRLGLSPELTQETGVGRMLAEMRVTVLGHCVPGDQLKVSARLLSVDQKSFITAHYMETRSGTPVALIEMCTLTVDMRTRKVTEVPSFLHQIASKR